MHARHARHALFALLATLLGLAAFAPRAAQAQIGTAFTYQGELQEGGVPYTGSADVRLRLYQDAVSGAFLSGFIVRSNVACVEGRFTTQLDFGSYLLVAGTHLQIEVRTPHDPTDSLPYTLLSPRQPLTPTPQAQLAELARTADFAFNANTASNATNATTATNATNANNANTLGGQSASFYQSASNLNAGTLPSARLSGTYSGALTLSNASNVLSGSGAGLTALSAANISTGTLSPARGGTGSSIASATVGDVLKWNGAAFTTQPDIDTNTTYSAGSGLSLAGTTFSIPTGGVTAAMIADGNVANLDLASDAASLQRVSGGAMRSDGTNTGIGSLAPASTLHLQTAAPTLAVQSTTNGGLAVFDLTETVGGESLGARIRYDGSTNRLAFGTIPSIGTFTTAMVISRGSVDVEFGGDVSAVSYSLPATTRSILLPPAAFVPSSSGNSYFLDAVGLQNTSGSGVQVSFYAPVSVPDGATITGFSLRCLDNDGTVDITVELHTVTFSTGSDVVSGVTTTTGGSASLRTFNSPALALAVNHATTSYTLRATWAGPLPNATFIKLVSVRVDYTITAPLP